MQNTLQASLPAEKQANLTARLRAVQARIAAAEASARQAEPGRPPVELVAVSKTFGPAEVLAVARAGQTTLGENYLQEALGKIDAVAAADPAIAARLCWHFIGPLQANKSRAVAERFAWVQTVDRERVAERLSAQRPAGMPPLQVLVQVNVSGEASKHGVAPDRALALARHVAALPRLQLRGLMALPEPDLPEAQARAALHQMHELLASLRQAGLPVDTLSMGMSGDLEWAIAEGATMVRIGTAIFGART